MEMIWRGSRNYEEKSQIFTGVLYNGYNPPPGFCYDEFCEDPPIQVSFFTKLFCIIIIQIKLWHLWYNCEKKYKLGIAKFNLLYFI